MAGRPNQNSIGRDAAAPGDCARPGAQPEDFLSRRTYDWAGSSLAGGRVGDADEYQVEAQPHDLDHDALHGRSGPPAQPDWEERLRALPGVTSVQNQSAGMFPVLTSNGSGTTTDLVEMSVVMGVGLKTLSVQNTTLDDVFVHYTGRQLRDELVKAHGFTMPESPGLRP